MGYVKEGANPKSSNRVGNYIKFKIMKEEISKEMMKSIWGGVSAKEYCDTLLEIFTNIENYENGNISQGACEGASAGAKKAGCSFSINCG
jgi:hypothetical protein